MGDNADIPFVPSSEDRLKTMIKLADIKPGQKTIDLGSGDGRVVVALAKEGAEAHGIELNPKLVNEAREKIKNEGMEGKAFIHQGNFWDYDLSDYDLVTIYGITSIMGRLEEKLQKELKTGSKIISNYFTFPSLEPEITDEKVFMYRKNL